MEDHYNDSMIDVLVERQMSYKKKDQPEVALCEDVFVTVVAQVLRHDHVVHLHKIIDFRDDDWYVHRGGVSKNDPYILFCMAAEWRDSCTPF